MTLIGRFEVKSYTQIHLERGKSQWEVNLEVWPQGGRVNIAVDRKFITSHPVGSQVSLTARALRQPTEGPDDL